MKLIEIAPAPCIHCGTGNVPDANGDRRQFVDLERDVNWDEPIVLCEDCGLMIGGLLDMPSPDMLQQATRTEAKLKQEIHDLKAKIDSQDRRITALGLKFTDDAAEAA